MLPYGDTRLTRMGLALFFVVIIGYGIYEGKGLLLGPNIDISSQVSTSHDPFVKIEGRAERIASLSMNGKDIPVTENGNFSEPFLLASGDNRILLEAKDKYGHATMHIVEIVYIPDSLAVAPETATSTAPETSTTTLQ